MPNIEELFTQATSNIVNNVESGKINLDTHLPHILY